MKVLLVQMDGKMPNLALMKLSRMHRLRGDKVGFHIGEPDRVYVSCIFKKNLSQALGVAKMYPGVETMFGGPAFEVPNHLPVEAEHLMPDYNLYPEMDFSLGYTQRGCPNNCPFCVVPKMEGAFREYASISEFQNDAFNNLVLYDNNFLASKLWREKLSYVESQGLKVCFNQGLDARLVDEERARWLVDAPSYNLSFENRTYYFAWDLMENSEAVIRGLQMMVDVGAKPRSLMCYVLVGFNTTHQEDLYRFTKLREMRIDPFIMVYNNRRDDPWIRHLGRWVNRRVYKSCKLEDYKDGVLGQVGDYRENESPLDAMRERVERT